jgi:hypothetical protein
MDNILNLILKKEYLVLLIIFILLSLNFEFKEPPKNNIDSLEIKGWVKVKLPIKNYIYNSKKNKTPVTLVNNNLKVLIPKAYLTNESNKVSDNYSQRLQSMLIKSEDLRKIVSKNIQLTQIIAIPYHHKNHSKKDINYELKL